MQTILSGPQARSVLAQVEQLVSLGSGPELCSRPELPAGPGVQGRFPHVVCCFLAALGSGWPWSFALEAFRDLDHGQFFENSCTFLSDNLRSLPPLAVWSCSSLCLAGDCVVCPFLLLPARWSWRRARHRSGLPLTGQLCHLFARSLAGFPLISGFLVTLAQASCSCPQQG